MYSKAHALLMKEFKGDRYCFGPGALESAGALTAQLGRRAVLIRDQFPGSAEFVDAIQASLTLNGVEIIGEIDGARPNAPREDLLRITAALSSLQPDVIVSFGGGSTIDAAKAASVLSSLGGTVDDYFGTGLVTKALAAQGKTLIPHLAIQTAASSGAHLTKYANITDLSTGQKKLIVDEAIVPARALFDDAVTYGAPLSLTMDGALDGVSHCLEVLYGAVGKPNYEQIEQVARAGIGLVIEYLPRVVQDPTDREARGALCQATDLGGYAIMLGGTNGGHLTSFSLVDILSHGRACALMNPYYTVFFAPVIERPLRMVLGLYQEAGFVKTAGEQPGGRELGEAVAEAMFELAHQIGFPTRLDDVSGFSHAHIERALAAAKSPQLKMKLENMPVPMTAEMIDEYMGPILEAARTGNLATIRNCS